MAKTIQLTFYINLTDQAEVTRLQALYPLGVSRGPLPAATEFSAPFIAEGAPISYPCTRTGWMPPGSAGKFPLDRAFFTINDGFFGHLFGRDQKYAWIGQFVFHPATTAEVVTPSGLVTPGPMREIAFAQGWETSPQGSTTGGDGETSDSGLNLPDASRLVDGMGASVRSDNGSIWALPWNLYGSGSINTRGWERFYVRSRVLGSADCRLWRLRWATGNEGMVLEVNSSGALIVRNVSSSGSLFPVGTQGFMGQGGNIAIPDAQGRPRWHCIDLVYNNKAGKSSIDVWIDHARVINVVLFDTTESAIDRNVGSVDMGGMANNSGHEIDIDDHVAFFLPANTGGNTGLNTYWNDTTNPGPDWLMGHHVQRLDPSATDATHSVNWTGDFRTLAQVGVTQSAEDALSSSTSGALAAIKFRGDLAVRRDGAVGWQALMISMHGRQTVAGNGSLGWSYNEAAGGSLTTNDTALTNQSTTNRWHVVAQRPTGLTAPKSIGDTVIARFTKAANANAAAITQLYAQMVLVGTWDQCDQRLPADGELVDANGDPIAAADIPQLPDPTRYGYHNRPYWRSPYVRTEVPPDSPVWVKAGTYTGNSLGQDLVAKIPAHFWLIRPTNNASSGVRWFSSMIAAAWGTAGDTRGGVNVAREDPDYVSAGGATDPESRSQIRIGGANAAENLNAVTYQYIAVGDPGARFLLNTHLRHDDAVTTFANDLVDPDFTPEWAYFKTEYIAAGGFMWQKGKDSAAGNGQRLDTPAEQTNVGTFALGRFTSLAGLHPSSPAGFACNFWRNRDGGDYASLGLTEPIPFQIFSYIGDGAASRTLALPRASGKRPLWAHIIPHGTSPGHVRDPSHTTNTSSLWNAGSSTVTTAITGGGVDQISVGTTLNANGTVYEVLVIMAADATAGNGGWGTNGEVLYDPIPAPGGQWDPGYTQDELDALENPVVPPVVDSFDDGPDLADDLADTVCVPFTLRAVNLALARIGISDKVTLASDLLSPTSQERSLVVEFYETALRYVLRDYPWAHATRYASLELLEGSISDPVNADWVYSFRAPTACLFVRRIIRPELGRKHDAKPPAFRMAVDDVGPLVYVTDDGVQFDSNDEPFVEIEYTIRPGCGARAGGDQKFVSAFAYRLAFELATALSRDEKTIARMERGYLIEKSSASTTVGNEQQTQPPGDPDWLLGR